MRTPALTWITCLGWLLFTSPAAAAESDAATAELLTEIPASIEVTSPEAPVTAKPEERPEESTGGLEPFQCSCDCLCPSGGYSEPVFFELPPWTNRLCETFDGERCSVKFDTCDQLRIYQNCKTL